DEWGQMSEQEKRTAALASQVEMGAMKQAVKNYTDKQTASLAVSDPSIIDTLDSMRIAAAEEAFQNAAPNTQQYLKITALDDQTLPGDTLQMSFKRFEMMVDSLIEANQTISNPAADQSIPDET